MFDSGLGGLSVLERAWTSFPGEEFVYLADTAAAPYGPRPAAWVRERVVAIAAMFARNFDVKGLLIACNTATAAGADAARARFPDLPIVAMEPGVKPAAQLTRSGVIGVLATAGTLSSGRFEALARRHAAHVRLLVSPCPGLVRHIEDGDNGSDAVRRILADALGPMVDAGADILVLGCTHYHFIQHAAKALLPPQVRILDTTDAVLRQWRARMPLQAAAAALRPPLLLATGDPDQASAAAQRLFPLDSPIQPFLRFAPAPPITSET